MKPSLQLKARPQVTITPQLQQAIGLLQLSSVELHQAVQAMLIANPMLESDDEMESAETATCDDTPYPTHTFHEYATSHAPADDMINQLSPTKTLTEYLLWQLQLSKTTAIEQIIGTALIDAIDDRGYLCASLNDLQKTLDSEGSITQDTIETMLHRIQCFDPAGVGAYDLRHCLLLQLERLPQTNNELTTAKAIVSKHLNTLAQQNYRCILRDLKIKKDTFNKAVTLIQTLHPEPGALITTSSTDYIVPDLLVKKHGEHLSIALNQAILPKLHIHSGYVKLIKRGNNTGDNLFLKTHLQEAKWFIKTLHNRHETLLQVARWIVSYQHSFFEFGDMALKPLSLKDIADNLNLHESTISRVTTQKYLHTPRGVFELKYFFSNAMITATGCLCSSKAIRATLKTIIASEDPKKPLSDNKLSSLLTAQGLPVARRTVAKYRHFLGIPSASQRKRSSVCKI